MKFSAGNREDKLKRIEHITYLGVRMYAPRTLGTRMAKGSGRLIVRSLSEDSTSVLFLNVADELYAKAILMSIKYRDSRISFTEPDFQTRPRTNTHQMRRETVVGAVRENERT